MLVNLNIKDEVALDIMYRKLAELYGWTEYGHRGFKKYYPEGPAFLILEHNGYVYSSADKKVRQDQLSPNETIQFLIHG